MNRSGSYPCIRLNNPNQSLPSKNSNKQKNPIETTTPAYGCFNKTDNILS